MASTNKTTNYNLSQYIGTDKPTYLGDYNSDMSKIDAQMHVNSEGISLLNSQIETVTQTANTANQNALSAQATAEEANSTGTSALEKATTNESDIIIANNNITMLKGTVLYNDANGSNGTITLSDTLDNYEYIEIYGRNNDNNYSSMKIYNANNKLFTFMIPDIVTYSGRPNLIIKINRYTATGNELVIDGGQELNILGNTFNTHNTNRTVYITRVIGYPKEQ